MIDNETMDEQQWNAHFAFLQKCSQEERQVTACSGDSSWFDSIIQALGGLSKTPIAHQPKGEFEDSPFLLSPING